MSYIVQIVKYCSSVVRLRKVVEALNYTKELIAYLISVAFRRSITYPFTYVNAL
jgi:hypothetical protein